MERTGWQTLRFAATLGLACVLFASDAEAAWTPPGEKNIVHEDITNGQLVEMGPDGKLVYKPYTDKGDKIMDYSRCGYKGSDEPIPNDVPTVVTLEPVPNSPEPVRTPAPEPKVVPKEEQGPLVWVRPGQKRFHDPRCRRAGAAIKDAMKDIAEGKEPANGYRQISYRKGTLSGLQYCRKCPKDAPRIEVKKPEHVAVMAYPDGPDSYQRIQAAIDKVSAMEPAANGYRGAVLLKKGTYYLKGGLKVYPGVVLRGEGDGMDGTVLVYRHPKGTGISLCKKEEPEPAAPAKKPAPPFWTKIADAWVPVGSLSVTVTDVGPFKVGDSVLVKKTVNWDWVKTLGMAAISGGKPWFPKNYQFGHLRVIRKIDGKRLTFDTPLPQGIVAAHGGGQVLNWGSSNKDKPSHMGVEKLRIIANYDRARISYFRGGADGYECDEENNLGCGIGLSRCRDSWVRNCTVMHVSHAAVVCSWSHFLTVRDCTALEPVSARRGGRRYCFYNTDSTCTLFYRCYAENGRHSYVTGSRDGGPIAFVMCTQKGGGSETHQRWASGVLFDNIEGGNISAVNRGGGGSGQGWSGANVVMWNCSAGIAVGNPPTPENNFAIGCILTGGKEPGGDGYVWSAGKHVTPRSLFVQQLTERIGRERVARVLGPSDPGDSGPTRPRAVVDADTLGTSPTAEGMQMFTGLLMERVRARVETGIQFTMAAPIGRVRVLSVDEDMLHVSSASVPASFPVVFKSLSPQAMQSLAHNVADDEEAGHAVAAFFMLAAGNVSEAHERLSKAGEYAALVLSATK